GMDILGSSMQLSADGGTLNVTTRVIDLSNPAGTAAAIAGTSNVQYVTRWQFGNTLYYAAMENTVANQPTFYAGKTQSIDLCSVSACFPHVLTYPEPSFGGTAEPGTITCPAAPSASNPCSVTIAVGVGDIGTGTLQAQDAGANMTFQASDFQSVVFNDATSSVTLVGIGTDNGNPVTFTAVAVNGGAGVGAFSLTLSDGYTNSGTLLDGNV